MVESVEQELQEEEYSIPYHFLLSKESLIAFPRTLQIAPAYLYYLEKVLFLMDELDDSKSLLDVGCGDGRLIRELRKRNCQASLQGADFSKRAIDFARVLNPGVSFDVVDLTDRLSLPKAEFDVVVSMEMLEHIPLAQVEVVIKNLAHLTKTGGQLILTVPHVNRNLDKKHYQHFDSQSLRKILLRKFDRVDLFGFYRQSVMNILFHCIVVTYYFMYPIRKIGAKFVTDFISKAGFGYFQKYLSDCGPDEGNSLIAVCRKA